MTDTDAVVVSPGDLAGLWSLARPGTDGPVVLGVDLRAPADAGAVLPDPLPDLVLVGVGPVAPEHARLAAALDLTLAPRGPAAAARWSIAVDDPPAELAELTAAAARAPRATTVLTDLLRWNGRLTVPAAIEVESFAYATVLAGEEFRSWLARRGDRPEPPDVDDPVLLARDGDTLRVTLNRPARRNAYGRLLRDALVDALDLAVADPSVTRVLLDGAGPAFCSGGDLDEFGTAPDPVVAHLVRTRGGAARRVHALAARTEVRVHGACVGAGVEIPALAGRVVAAPDATFRLPEIGMGLIPGAGGTVGIPRRIGRRRALYLALSGRAVDAGTALDWGLVDRIDP
ncbi:MULTISPECIES: enoyl-CoA hydratase/isomerase family protein [Pseudonocardia]|uniref:2,3-dehydroadipyl-CoA hydratase n=2 Tax=Pseudonocardia TaxID=1847 RepID=A0A1Y2MQ06_PSEAH|nr:MULTISPECIES: enoyl-CoA hydratase/isomerase family protein [Pseudonocardia]OSY37069.1 2,3-dehydroadipyl-CoA hydratase [Pseudonocardia autotrophica]TDN72042.1 enoyl-CoA hydratase/carnithine racemase [Pseudonocardia autotrophica]BBG02737.1 enoyl-CoA hydratase [Pseudonocardia autotrophica]GEC25930.1 enoyl-CoA hydratase [Pseudonocardia saturnea]